MLLGRSEEGPAPCPVFKGFLELPKEVPEPLGARKHRRTGRSGSRGGSRAPSSRRDTSTAPGSGSGSAGYGGIPPEDGLDDDTAVDGTVKDWISGQPIRRRKLSFSGLHFFFQLLIVASYLGLVYTQKQIDIDDASGGPFSFRKVFGDDDFIASGLITFPIGGHKPHKSSKDNTYVSTEHGKEANELE